MTFTRSMTRRGLLLTGAGGAAAVALAACSSSAARKQGSSDVVAAPTAGGGGSSSSADDSGSGEDASSSASSSSGGSGSSASGGAVLATLASVPVGGAVSVTLPNGKPGIVARPTSSTAACFSAICTHMGCTVAPAGKKLDCPCHGSVYDASTGKVLNGPAPSPLAKIAVTVQNGKVVEA